MKRVLTLAITSAALAFAATPAMAGLPNGDTNPNHYSAVTHIPSGTCVPASCTFTGNTDLTHTLHLSTGPRNHRCQNPAVPYLLQSSGGAITNFEISGMYQSCPGVALQKAYGRDHAICAYSPTGNFNPTSGYNSNIQFWVRNDFGITVNGTPAFGKIDHDGYPAYFPVGYIVIDTIEYDNQQIGDNLAPPNLDEWTVDGIVNTDSENVALQANTTGGTCSAFPEV